MREVFKADKPRDPGRVFYTILPEDVGKSVIMTEIGAINVVAAIGRVMKQDVGKRLFRKPNLAKDAWFWSIESNADYDRRMGK